MLGRHSSVGGVIYFYETLCEARNCKRGRGRITRPHLSSSPSSRVFAPVSCCSTRYVYHHHPHKAEIPDRAQTCVRMRAIYQCAFTFLGHGTHTSRVNQQHAHARNAERRVSALRSYAHRARRPNGSSFLNHTRRAIHATYRMHASLL